MAGSGTFIESASSKSTDVHHLPTQAMNSKIWLVLPKIASINNKITGTCTGHPKYIEDQRVSPQWVPDSLHCPETQCWSKKFLHVDTPPARTQRHAGWSSAEDVHLQNLCRTAQTWWIKYVNLNHSPQIYSFNLKTIIIMTIK